MKRSILKITLGQLRGLEELGYLSEKGIKEMESLEEKMEKLGETIEGVEYFDEDTSLSEGEKQ